MWICAGSKDAQKQLARTSLSLGFLARDGLTVDWWFQSGHHKERELGFWIKSVSVRESKRLLNFLFAQWRESEPISRAFTLCKSPLRSWSSPRRSSVMAAFLRQESREVADISRVHLRVSTQGRKFNSVRTIFRWLTFKIKYWQW